jgi:hypothetical protein
MSKSLQKIERELEAIATQFAEFEGRFREQYGQYLVSLGASIQRQLILVTYQICTSTYPTEFLALSGGDRERLQQAIQALGREAATQLPGLLDRPLRSPQPSSSSGSPIFNKLPISPEQLQLLKEKLLEQREQFEQKANDEDGDTSIEFITIEADLDLLAADDEDDDDDDEDDDETVDGEDEATEEETDAGLPPTNPVEFAQWLKQLDGAIATHLKTLSTKANRLLQTQGIMAHKLPPKVIEAAMQSEEGSVGQMPNLLNVLVETEQVKGDRAAGMVQVTAVRLRLAEIEFAEPQVAAYQSKLRELRAQAHRLAKQYHTLKREESVATAEAAWRASWYEPS